MQWQWQQQWSLQCDWARTGRQRGGGRTRRCNGFRNAGCYFTQCKQVGPFAFVVSVV